MLVVLQCAVRRNRRSHHWRLAGSKVRVTVEHLCTGDFGQLGELRVQVRIALRLDLTLVRLLAAVEYRLHDGHAIAFDLTERRETHPVQPAVVDCKTMPHEAMAERSRYTHACVAREAHGGKCRAVARG